jgi:hypothetical protein
MTARTASPRAARQALELAHLQARLADANRRADGAQRMAAEARRVAQDADRALAAYPALLRRVELLRAELVRVGALLGRAAVHVHGDQDLVGKIREALASAGAAAASTTDCPVAPARAEVQGG